MEPVTQQQETVTKQKHPLTIEQGKTLFEYNHRKEEELKRFNQQVTKQDDIAEHKPNMNNYVYASSLSVLGLAISGYLPYSKFRKPEQDLIDVLPPPMVRTSTEPKKIFLKCSKNFHYIIYKWLKTIRKI